MAEKRAEYDAFAEEYKESKQLSFRKHVEEYTLFNILGKVEGKEVLDLACGEGFYTRKLKNKGASEILGVDISEEMIQLAKKEEQRNPIGCAYLTADVSAWKPPKQYDVVTGMYLLNYATSPETLLAFCRVIFEALKPGCIFAGLNDNIMVNPENAVSYRNYGFTKASSNPQHEGDAVKYVFYNADGSTFTFNNFFLEKETYERAFEEAGFSSFEWMGPFLEPSQTGNSFWDDFMLYPPIIGLKAIR